MPCLHLHAAKETDILYKRGKVILFKDQIVHVNLYMCRVNDLCRRICTEDSSGRVHQSANTIPTLFRFVQIKKYSTVFKIRL
jgi:hypothetical protein